MHIYIIARIYRSAKRRRRYEICHPSFGAWVEVKKGRLRRFLRRDGKQRIEIFQKFVFALQMVDLWANTYGLLSKRLVPRGSLAPRNVSSSIFGLRAPVKRFTKNKRLLHVPGNGVLVQFLSEVELGLPLIFFFESQKENFYSRKIKELVPYD